MKNEADPKTFHIETGTQIVRISHPGNGCDKEPFFGFTEIKAPTLEEAIRMVLRKSCGSCGTELVLD